jgi:hypothetical protein
MVKIMNPKRFITKVTILMPPEVTYRFEGDAKAGSATALP